jgi:hypothetical protein
MIEDKKYMTLLETIGKELETAAVNFNQSFNGMDDRDQVLALLVAHNDLLAEMAHRHRRAIDFVAGREVKPEVQFASGVLIGVGGGGFQ